MWLCFELVDGGHITSEQAMQVLNQQVTCRKPIGQLAVECELMKMGEVFDVLIQQSRSPLPFGELAVEMGYLNREQLGELVLRQLDTIPSLAQLVVEAGMMTQEEIDEAIKTKRRDRMSAAGEQQLELLSL